MNLFRNFSLLALIVAFTAFSVSPQDAQAGYESITGTVAMDSGTSIATETITLENVNVRDLIVFCPTLDSGDTASVALTAAANGTTYVPDAWDNVSIGATADNANIDCFSTTTQMVIGSSITLTLAASTNQAAAREWKYTLIYEY